MGIVLVAFLAARAAGVAGRKDHVQLEPNQLGREGGKLFDGVPVKSALDDDVPALDIPEVPQPLEEAPQRCEAFGLVGEDAARRPIRNALAGSCASAASGAARRARIATRMMRSMSVIALPARWKRLQERIETGGAASTGFRRPRA